MIMIICPVGVSTSLKRSAKHWNFWTFADRRDTTYLPINRSQDVSRDGGIDIEVPLIKDGYTLSWVRGVGTKSCGETLRRFARSTRMRGRRCRTQCLSSLLANGDHTAGFTHIGIDHIHEGVCIHAGAYFEHITNVERKA